MFCHKYVLTTLFTGLFCWGVFLPAYGQKDATLDVPKPEQYSNRILGSDKTFTTKYTVPRRLFQGMTTHYNFFFNANVKLAEVVEGAKKSFKEDYTELLPFYNYTLDATAAQKTELDSVLQKCNAGILLHDLRNEWIDDMYFLMGQAYFFKKEFDSAYAAFQYLNYYFQPKTKKEIGFKKYIGSNLNDEGNVYSVSTKEKTGIIQKTFSEPPRRNDALVWQLRNFIEDSSYNAASALVQTLRRDELFPKRLKPALEEMHAYYFYKNKVWDSAAYFLIPALENTRTQDEKARREFLIAQLYGLQKNIKEAEYYYDRCIKHAIDPVMEVYARLNKIKLTQGERGEEVIEENIKQLLKMARRDKYYNYRNIIYYMAAQMEMQRNNYEGAKTWLLRSVKYNPENLEQRNRSYLYLGNLAFEQKEYELAYAAYDSLDLNSEVVKNGEALTLRKDVLGGIVKKLHTVQKEDSLQHLAALPEEERDKYIKAAVKRLRKEKGLKEMDSFSANVNNPFANTVSTDIFAGNESKGDWYFNNNGLKSRGFTTFRNTWGSRPNVDNWRRMADVLGQSKSPAFAERDASAEENTGEAAGGPEDISYEGLMKTLPLTPEAVKVSNDSIQSALFGLGESFKNQLEDYAEAIKYYESLLNRFPETRYREEAIFSLYYCYTKLNLPIKAKQYREILAQVAPQSPYIEYIDDPKAVEERRSKLKNEATRNYEQIYNLFLEGKFEEAIIKKIQTDSIYGNAYWTQQLLYIESIYYIKQQDNNSAVHALQTLISMEPGTPVAVKAATLLDVLERREQIENYLTRLNITRAQEDTVAVVKETRPVEGKREEVALTEQPRSKEIGIVKEIVRKPVVDSSIFNKPKEVAPTGFTYNPNAVHVVAMVLHKVDVVYGNEVKNAFTRYNRESFRNLDIQMALLPVDADYKLLVMSGFTGIPDALEYIQKTKRMAGTQIVPWLAADKYSFMIISEQNLELLKNNKDFDGYSQFFDANYPVE